MKWYEGDIAQAVAISKSKNAIFVVYIEGKDEKSTNLTSQINHDEISSKLESSTFVSLKIEAGSISHNQFGAIYKNIPVPSIYFIGKNGKPIDIIAESPEVQNLAKRIDNVIETHTGVSTTSSEVNLSTKSSNDKQSVVLEDDKPTQQQCENGVCLTSSSEAASLQGSKTPMSAVSSVSSINSVDSTGSSVDTDKLLNDEKNPEPKGAAETSQFLQEEKKALSETDKIKRAKELVEKKREIRQKEEEEAAKLKEIERRKMGKDVQQLQRWQQDKDLKILMEERQRAKNEEKAARERILAQIAQDKADRAARFSTAPPPVTNSVSTEATNVIKPTNSNSNMARLQFRLPDGSNSTHDFESSDTLQEVRNYIILNLNLPFKNFNLSTTFPRREFSEDDYEQTLVDLELYPNAVVLILPVNSTGAVQTHDEGGFMSFFWVLLSPILGIFGYFRNLIFGSPQKKDKININERNKRSTMDASESQPLPPNKRKATESTVIRRQGNSNVHRLSDRTDSDEDNNTWNGNSTQQM